LSEIAAQSPGKIGRVSGVLNGRRNAKQGKEFERRGFRCRSLFAVKKARIVSGCDSRSDNWSLPPVAIEAAAQVTKQHPEGRVELDPDPWPA
jgi:hypothetical protein